MPLVPQDKVHHFLDCARGIQCTVNVPDWNRMGQGPGGESLGSDKIPINEESSGSTVQECSYPLDHSSVRRLYLNLKGKGTGSGFRRPDVGAREFAFPSTMTCGVSLQR